MTPDPYLIEQDKIKKLLNQYLNPAWNKMPNDSLPHVLSEIVSWHNLRNPYPVLNNELSLIETRPEPSPESMPDKVKTALRRIVSTIGSAIPEAKIFLHGSFATSDYAESSDLDLTVALPYHDSSNKKALKSLKSLRSAMFFVSDIIKTVDPLQHHGPYFLSYKMLDNYLESYLPIKVWRNSVPLNCANNIILCNVKSSYHDKLWFEKSVSYYISLHPSSVQSLYDRKRFVCMANMIPCVLYPWATGKYTTKPEAFKWMAVKYPFAIPWLADLKVRRDSNNYEGIGYLIKATAEICSRIKETQAKETQASERGEQ